MKNEWIQALGNMTYGIYVLTSFYKEELNGMIASWVSQVSYDPLLIKECMAYFECSVTAEYTPGNHTLFLGEVLEAQVIGRGNVLSTLDYDGVYLGKS